MPKKATVAANPAGKLVVEECGANVHEDVSPLEREGGGTH
jgi:hypothetical protein